MSSGKVKCTCGWSWNKSDSSKKDMYICHECGRDNSNNMKNGGWLDNYGEEANANGGSSSAPDNWTGDGYSNVGRNYSPAWGGQFQMGGFIPKAEDGIETTTQETTIFPNGKAFLRKLKAEAAAKKKNVPVRETPSPTVRDATATKKVKVDKPVKEYEPEDMYDPSIPEEVRNQITYAKYKDDPKQNFSIVDKNNNVMYYVNPDGDIIGHENIISGATNKDKEHAPSMLEYGKTANEYYDYLKNTNQRVTPAGSFTLYSNKNNSYGQPHSLWDRALSALPFVDDVNLNTLDDPSLLHAVYNEMPWREEEKKEYYDHRRESYGPTGNMFRMVSEYGVPSSKGLHGTGNTNRISALNTPGANKNLSNGCINVGGKTMCFDMLKDKSKLYILPEEKDKYGEKQDYVEHKTVKYEPFGHYDDNGNWVDEKDDKLSREDIRKGKVTRAKIADIIKKNKIDASPEEIDFAAAVAQKETKGGESWLSSAESTLPGFSSYGLYEQKEDFPYLKGKSPNDDAAATQAVIDFYRDMMRKHPELMSDGYADEKMYSTYNSGSEDWDKGIHHGSGFRKALQSVKEYQSGGSIPGAVGFSYARTQSPAPSNGPYAKKTKASAENGGWLSKYDDAQNGYQTGDKVTYGTPEYTEAYNKGEVVTEDGQRSPILLDEVTIQNDYRRPRGFWEQYADKIAEENKDAGLFGAIVGTPISAITSLPQLAATYGVTGEMQRPSEAMDIQNPYGAFAVDAIADPANLIGAGILTKENALAKLANLKNINAEGKVFSGINNELSNMAIRDIENYMSKRTPSQSLQKGLEPYASSYVKPISREEEVIRMSMGPEYRAKKLAEDTVYLDPEGNVIPNPTETYSPFVEDEYMKLINAEKNKNIDVVPDERSKIRSSSVIDINDVAPKKFNFTKKDLSEGNNIKYEYFDKSGNKVSTFSGKKGPEGIYVNSINVEPKFRRKGLASDIYKNITKDLQSKNEGTLLSRSTQHQFTDTDELGRSIAPANKLWENLVNKGEAEKFVEGMSHSYRMKPLKQGGIINSDRGQWDHPGKVTRIKGGNITMKPDPKTGKPLTKPLLGIANTGERKMMYPGQDYQFQEGTEYVTEYPKSKLAKNGNQLVKLDQLTNFTNYNKPQPGGWLNKYN